jgi:hypothetical protein
LDTFYKAANTPERPDSHGNRAGLSDILAFYQKGIKESRLWQIIYRQIQFTPGAKAWVLPLFRLAWRAKIPKTLDFNQLSLRQHRPTP